MAQLTEIDKDVRLTRFLHSTIILRVSCWKCPANEKANFQSRSENFQAEFTYTFLFSFTGKL